MTPAPPWLRAYLVPDFFKQRILLTSFLLFVPDSNGVGTFHALPPIN